MEQKQANLFAADFLEEAKSTAGLDEAGRGCLAGPVVAAAVILPEDAALAGLKDSKKLTPNARALLEKQIKKTALSWSLGVVWPKRIDRINILNATLEAMCRAAKNLAPAPKLLLIDGNQPIRQSIISSIWPFPSFPRQRTVIDGDNLIPVISAASIIAKTFRDRLMIHLARRWPGYGFETHKGYGTIEHRQKLKALGPCPAHRLTFNGVMTPHA